MKLVFCSHCGAKKEIIYETKTTLGELNGVKLTYEETVALCEDCGEEVYVGELHDKNLNALYDAYRKEMGLVSLQEVQDMASKFNVGIRNLSKILGWGEHTLERFLDGYIPSRNYSEEIKEVLSDVKYFLKKLESNKNRITEKVYKKATEIVNRVRVIYHENPPINIAPMQFSFTGKAALAA